MTSIKVGILSSEKGWHATALEEAFNGLGIQTAFFSITDLAVWNGDKKYVEVKGDRLNDCQAVMVRTIPIGSLEQIIFRMDVLHRLENLGVLVINTPSAIEKTVDKFYTDFLLRDAGILTPRTIVTEDFGQALDGFCELGDVILKPLFGSEGKGMRRISDADTAYRIFRSLELERYVFYMQEYIPHRNEDYRVFVIGDEVVAAMKRTGPNWKTNYANGAKVEQVNLTDQMIELSLQAAKVVGVDYGGVDLLPAEDGRIFVLEVNSIPGWRGLRKTVNFNVADRIVEYAISLVKHGR